MKNLKAKTALAAVTLAAMTIAAPMSASAGDYNRKCKDTTNGIVGGLIGGSAGAAIGEGIAGRGDKTEGAILGAIIGGIAGAAVGDGVNDCEKDNRYAGRTYGTAATYPANYPTTSYPTTTTRTYPTTTRTYPTTTTRTYPVTTTSYPTRTVTTTDHVYQTSHVGHGHSTYHRRGDRLYQINRKIDELRHERAYLKDERARSRGYRPGIEHRLDRIAYRLDELKREKRRIKKYRKRRANYSRPTYTTRHSHNHGSSRHQYYSGY